MRLASLSRSTVALLAAALAVPSAAFADTITFAPTNGSPSVTFTFDPTNPMAVSSGQDSVFESAAYGGTGLVADDGAAYNVLYLLDPDFTASLGYGYASVYFSSYDPNLGINETQLLAGPLIFTGDAAAPALVPGTYTLTDEISGSNTTLTVDGGLSPAPEPSSLMLLGTGVLGLGGVLRRKVTG